MLFSQKCSGNDRASHAVASDHELANKREARSRLIRSRTEACGKPERIALQLTDNSPQDVATASSDLHRLMSANANAQGARVATIDVERTTGIIVNRVFLYCHGDRLSNM